MKPIFIKFIRAAATVAAFAIPVDALAAGTPGAPPGPPHPGRGIGAGTEVLDRRLLAELVQRDLAVEGGGPGAGAAQQRLHAILLAGPTR